MTASFTERSTSIGSARITGAQIRLAPLSCIHGPRYHGVQQEDVGTGHGHKLIDTASLARTIVRQAYGLESQPFTLSIAGYGTGKSHLALTLATLLDAPSGPTAECVLSSLTAADDAIGSEVKAILAEAKQQPCLVVALNGMQSFDLTAEVTRQLEERDQERGIDSASSKTAPAISACRQPDPHVERGCRERADPPL